MCDTEPRLALLHADIEARVQAIRGAHRPWPCGKGCGGCCRRLAEVPSLTGAEWALLREGLAALPPQPLGAIRRAVAALADQPSGPVLCPLLDQTTNACRVYPQRPVACRTYGFYVQRGLGLYCRDLEALVADGTMACVVWGNHDAIDHRLAGLGQPRALTQWFADWAVARGIPTAAPQVHGTVGG